MTGALDPRNEFSYLDVPPKAYASNTGAFIGNLVGFEGKVNVRLQIGLKTVGDSDGALTLKVATSATNNISNAVNYVPTTGGNSVATTNNTLANGSISVDTRDALGPFLFLVPAVTGTNSPSYPVGGTVVGTKQIQ